jgi:UDP:flavonoid glycosyltransferase YjiC (YdhE family)
VRVLAACSLGGAGHLRPLVPFLDAARRLGHRTVVVGPPAMATMLEETGHPFELGGEPREDAVAPIREQLPRVDPALASVLAERDLFGRLAARAMLPRMTSVFDDFGPDFVLRDPCEYASAVVAHSRGVPMAQVAISLAEAEGEALRSASPALEEHRLGLTDALLAATYLTRFPASLDPSPFGATIRVREPGGHVEPIPDWWPERRGPLVYVTFGTVLGYMSIAGDVYRTVLRALGGLGDLDARILLTVGHHVDVAGLHVDTAPSVHVEAWVDQERVLGSADVVVCHGGSGTVYGALAAGVPVVVVPVFADQFENGTRVARHGAGLVVADDDHGAGRTGRRVVDDRHVPAIGGAVRTVLGEDGYRLAARRIAAEMAAEPVIDEALAAVLAHART